MLQNITDTNMTLNKLDEQLDYLHANGLAKGASLDNAVGITANGIANPEGFRYPDEFVKHKLLDAIGDLALFGLPIIGRVNLHRSGHALNTKLVQTVLNDPKAYEIVEPAVERENYEAAFDISSFAVFEPVESLV